MKELLAVIGDSIAGRLPTESYQRVGLGLQARQVAHEGVFVPLDDPFSIDKQYGPGEVDVLFPRFKAERYVVASVIADRVVNRALANREQHPPLGFVPQDNFYSRTWWNGMNQALDTARREEFRSLDALVQKTDDNPELAQIYKRFQQLELFGRINYPYVESFSNGLTTAVAVMFESLAKIAEKHKDETGKDISPVELQVVARNSYGLIAELAGNHLYSMISARDLNLQTVDLLDTAKGKKLDLNEKGRKRFKKRPRSAANRRIKVDLNVHGCPALISIDGSSPIKKLWDWVVEIAPEIDVQNLQALRPPSNNLQVGI